MTLSPTSKTPSLTTVRKRIDTGGAMPFRSAKQRKYMFAKHPKIAHRWAKKYGTKPRPKKS